MSDKSLNMNRVDIMYNKLVNCNKTVLDYMFSDQEYTFWRLCALFSTDEATKGTFEEFKTVLRKFLQTHPQYNYTL
jgi:hypothetical protein|uniref:Uncharacterized protein n=1 Tax=viral metagenome TaxID=1070528 RepID=A0A6C0CYW6_9ZZZZ